MDVRSNTSQLGWNTKKHGLLQSQAVFFVDQVFVEQVCTGDLLTIDSEYKAETTPSDIGRSANSVVNIRSAASDPFTGYV